MQRKRSLTELGRQIRAELDRKGWTQRELADKCGINYCVVNYVIIGQNRKLEEKLQMIRSFGANESEMLEIERKIRRIAVMTGNTSADVADTIANEIMKG